MKKIIITMFLTIVGCITVMAGDEIKVINGNASVLKEKSVALVEFDWEGATWDNEKSLEEQWSNDYATIISESEATFIAQFNKKNKKGLQLSDSIEDSPITISVKITNADKHWSWGMVTSIWGTIAVLKDGQEVLKVKLTKIEGEGDNSADDSVARCFLEIANKFVKVK